MVDQQQRSDLSWRWPDYSPSATDRARMLTNGKLQRELERQQSRSSLKKLQELRKAKGAEQIKSDIAASIARVKARSNADSDLPTPE